MTSKEKLFKYIDENEKKYSELNGALFDSPEPCFMEFKTFEIQKSFMENEGFSITTPVAGLDTAFIAEYGEGGPVIAIVDSMDALPGASQEADAFEPRPVIEGGSGHGCGHHLLCTGCIETACALKELIAAGDIKGTVRLYACPAEEGGGGKVFMTMHGAFDGVDAVLTWHPMPENNHGGGSLACVTVKYAFTGTAAHAAAAPWEGRSALDAAELMNVGVQFLREHILPTCRIHYAVTGNGGDAPNVVQPSAELLYSIRAERSEVLKDVFARVTKIAEGAALMTGTVAEKPIIVSAYTEKLVNPVLDELLAKKFDEIPAPEYTDDELEYLSHYRKAGAMPDSKVEIDTDVHPMSPVPGASTDMSDVSWTAPTGNIGVACFAVGTRPHSWAMTAQGKSSAALKGVWRAAKMMCSAAYDLYTDSELLGRAKAAYERQRGGREYTTLIPRDTRPGMYD